MEDEKFLIGEVAQLLDISRKTLIHYEEIGLIKPAYVNEENGYRYYHPKQMKDLKFIITLKKAGFSLNEIKKYAELKNSNEVIEFLKEKDEEIELKIKELKKYRKILKEKSDEFKFLNKWELNKPKIIEAGPIYATMLEMNMEHILSKKNKLESIKAVWEYFKESEIKEEDMENNKKIALLDIGKFKTEGKIKTEGVGFIHGKNKKNPTNIIKRKKYLMTIVRLKNSLEDIRKEMMELMVYAELNNIKLGNEVALISGGWAVGGKNGVGWVVSILIEIL